MSTYLSIADMANEAFEKVRNNYLLICLSKLCSHHHLAIRFLILFIYFFNYLQDTAFNLGEENDDH